MKFHALRTFSAIGLAIFLTACGGSASQIDAPATRTAVAVMTSSAALNTPTSTMPAPDCAADGCKGLRIIDANAEAYRFEAMRRAAIEQAANGAQS